ncbi:hypothetical protein H4Q26_012525 [Puccinia striiformis f. sp. tritici PST-130]|nr:hypothetical protein H4Q26_012525 [Puccinia striiformis f. sp. tritici PST-130]
MNTNYEEIFLEALSDPNKLGLLSKLIDDQDHPLQSKLSQPVLLTLAHKLSEDLATPMADSILSGIIPHPLSIIMSSLLALLELIDYDGYGAV